MIVVGVFTSVAGRELLIVQQVCIHQLLVELLKVICWLLLLTLHVMAALVRQRALVLYLALYHGDVLLEFFELLLQLLLVREVQLLVFGEQFLHLLGFWVLWSWCHLLLLARQSLK